MGHKISKEQIDPSVKDHIMSFVGNKNELETSDKSDMVNAINSLIVDRVDNINNITKLANSIGNPITASDNVDEACDKVNGLLSTFKTNMMNNGVVVESNDRFKQLIDKIATLADNEGKGIQYASGTVLKSSEQKNFTDMQGDTVQYPTATVNDLKFKPSVVIITDLDPGNMEFVTLYKDDGISSDRCYLFCGRRDSISAGAVSDMININGCTINDTGFILPVDDYTNNSVTYHAFGVGEEDTTLRDSLASILEEEGVVVAPEDDMANLISKTDEEFNKKINTISGLEGEIANKNNTISGLEGDIKNNRDSLASILQDEGVSVTTGDNLASLITKVDNEFDRKNANTGLNIISATKLPATGKENQICVITNNPVDNFIITGNSAESSNNKIVIYNGTGNSNYSVVKNNITYSYNIGRVRYQSNYLFSYYWKNNQWNRLTVGNIPLFENGEFLNTDITGGFGTAAGTTISGSNFAFVGPRDYSLLSTTKKEIVFSNFKTLKVTLYSDTSASFVVGSFKRMYSGQQSASFTTTGKTNNEYSIQPSTSPTEISISVSGWTTGYLGFFRSSQTLAPSIYITKITLE